MLLASGHPLMIGPSLDFGLAIAVPISLTINSRLHALRDTYTSVEVYDNGVGLHEVAGGPEQACLHGLAVALVAVPEAVF